MTNKLSPTTAAVDAILNLQFRVAWAGEALCAPPRLKWWRTDLVDEMSGGDFMRRLAPRTHRWAALEAVREAARLTDLKARHRPDDPLLAAQMLAACLTPFNQEYPLTFFRVAK